MRTASPSTISRSTDVSASISASRARAIRSLVCEPAGAVDAVHDDVAVAVEDVVDDLEQEAELVAERTPDALPVLGHAGSPQRESDRGREQAAGLQLVQRRLVGRGARASRYWPPIIPSVASETPRDARGVVRGGEPERLPEQRVPCEDPDRLAVLLPRRRLSPPLLVVVERRQVVVDERERVHELERAAGRERRLRLRAGGLGDGEADHRPDPLAADGDRVANRLRLAVQLRPELEPRGTPRRADAALQDFWASASAPAWRAQLFLDAFRELRARRGSQRPLRRAFLACEPVELAARTSSRASSSSARDRESWCSCQPPCRSVGYVHEPAGLAGRILLGGVTASSITAPADLARVELVDRDPRMFRSTAPRRSAVQPDSSAACDPTVELHGVADVPGDRLRSRRSRPRRAPRRPLGHVPLVEQGERGSAPRGG